MKLEYHFSLTNILSLLQQRQMYCQRKKKQKEEYSSNKHTASRMDGKDNKIESFKSN